MTIQNTSSNRRSFIKGAGSASIVTLLAAEGGTAFAQTKANSSNTAPLPTKGITYTYTTENAWGPITEWHPAANLSFNVDSGTEHPPASLYWRDQQGNSFAISFASDMSTFFGYFQRYNEGPIAYRGKLVIGDWRSRP